MPTYVLAASTYTPCAHWLVDGTQVVSAVLGLVALVFALTALVKSKSDLLRERRVAHELEILRGLADVPAYEQDNPTAPGGSYEGCTEPGKRLEYIRFYCLHNELVDAINRRVQGGASR